MNIFERVICVIAPHSCLGCEREGMAVCNGCLYSLLSSPPSRCAFCKKLTDYSSTCPTCRRNTPLRHVWVVNEYEDLAKKIVRAYKFDKKRELASPMARSLCDAMPISSEQYLVVSIPTVTSHIRERGFDHAALLAKEFADRAKLPYRNVLQRLDQSKQVGKTRELRLKSMYSTMRVTGARSVKNERILLVDDVITTGATLTEAAKLLKAAGARSVDALIFAQA